MKTYSIFIINGVNSYRNSVNTESLDSSEKGFYTFKIGTNIVGAYPITRTIIESITKIKNLTELD